MTNEVDVVISKRIKQAREYIGVSQATFGEMAGLDKRDANIRLNQYERGVHEPKYNFVCKLAEAARLPEYFFYIKEDETAKTLISCIQSGKDFIVKL